MKFYETNFNEYLKSQELTSLHNIKNHKLNSIENSVIYGPSGIGKYTQSLSIIKNYSPSKLKYEKKIALTYNKNT